MSPREPMPPTAFEDIVRPHLEHLYRVAYRLTGRGHDAEDLVQELLVKLYPRRRELAHVERLRPWLLRVMYRQFIDHTRRHARSPVHLAVDNTADDPHGDPMEAFASSDHDPERHVEDDIRNRRLLHAIEHLSEDHRAVLMLHDVEGYKLEEMQTILDCPIGTLKSRLHRARARLRELLDGADSVL